MGSKLSTVIQFTAASCLTSSAALACSPPPSLSEANIRAFARASYNRADVIVDASVDMAANTDAQLTGAVPLSVLKTERVWKGNTKDLFGIIALSSCDAVFDQKGARYRLLLRRVKDELFTADIVENGIAADNISPFNDEIDRLVQNRRSAGYSNVGQIADRVPVSAAGAGRDVSPSAFSISKLALLIAVAASAVLSSMATFLAMRKQGTGT